MKDSATSDQTDPDGFGVHDMWKVRRLLEEGPSTVASLEPGMHVREIELSGRITLTQIILRGVLRPFLMQKAVKKFYMAHRRKEWFDNLSIE